MSLDSRIRYLFDHCVVVGCTVGDGDRIIQEPFVYEDLANPARRAGGGSPQLSEHLIAECRPAIVGHSLEGLIVGQAVQLAQRDECRPELQ